MYCKICNNNNKSQFKSTIMNKYIVDYFHCAKCGFLQTEYPFWLEEAYAEPINITDTGYLQRNLYLSQKLTIILRHMFDKEAKYLDYAGGYGVFVRLMRDVGFDFYWDDKFTANLFAKGFEYKMGGVGIDAITTFESFEHFVSPVEEIDNMLNISKNIIFTTNLLPDPIPKPDEWWYYGLEHGQHISFYSHNTMKFLANKYALNYYYLGGIHVLTANRLNCLLKMLVKFTKLGLHKFYQRSLTSKTWDDSRKLSSFTD